MLDVMPSQNYLIQTYQPVLDWIRDKVRLSSQAEVAEFMRLSPPTVASLMTCNGRMRGRTLVAVANAMDIPLQDFCLRFSVIADQYNHNRQKKVKKSRLLEKQPLPSPPPKPMGLPQPQDNQVAIPIFSVAASAGYGINNDFSAFEVDCAIKFDRVFLRQYTFNIDSLHGLYVQGDSMIPNFYPNDVVIVDPAWSGLRSGVYVIVMGEDVLIKRLFRLPKAIQVVSDNESYPSFEVPLSTSDHEFKIVSKVVMRLHKV